MSTLLAAWLTLPVQLYLANVAVISVLVCGAGLIAEQLCRRVSLPFRHTLLVGTLISAVSTPIVIGVMLASGRSLIQFDVASMNAPITTKVLPTSSGRGEGFGSSEDVPAQDVRLASAADKNGAADTTTFRAETSTGAPMVSHGGRSAWLEVLPRVGMSLALIWIAGCALGVYRLIRGLLKLRDLHRGVRPVADESLCELAAATARQVGLPKVPKVYESETILSPLSFGLFHPSIVLPQGIVWAFDEDQVRGLFLHEMAHIARRDHWVGALQRLATILFWWNMLTRRACAQISTIREQICDDISTVAGSGDTYAALLVELASRIVYSNALSGTIGMFDGKQSDFSQRIHRLLNPHRLIVTRLGGRAKTAAVICFALLLLPATATWQVRAVAVEQLSPAEKTDETKKTANVEAAKGTDDKNQSITGLEAPVFVWPKVLRGVIKDADGKPITGAKVRLDFEKIHEYSIGRWDELLDSQTLETGDDGKFSFDAEKFPKLTHRPFVLTITCTADGYADAKWWNWYTRSDTKLGEHVTDIKMKPGRVVLGRCVDPEGNPVSRAIVKMASDYDVKALTQSESWDPRKTKDDGTFEFSIPRDSEAGIEIWAVDPQWAPQHATLVKGSDTFGDIRLQQGAPLHGTVRNADGTPVIGTVVAAVSIDDGKLDMVTFPANIAARTDAEGNYTIQPLAGAWKVYLTQAEKNDNRLEDRFVVADGPPPPVVPARVEPIGSEPHSQDFRAGPTLKVRGTVRWPDGRPVMHLEVKASYMPRGNGTGIWIDRTLTDDEGHYVLQVPNPIDDVSINVVGAHHEHVWYSAFPADTVDAKSKSQQFINLYPLKGDVEGMDWVLKQPEKN